MRPFAIGAYSNILLDMLRIWAAEAGPLRCAFAEDDVLDVGGGDVLFNGFFSKTRIDIIVQISPGYASYPYSSFRLFR